MKLEGGVEQAEVISALVSAGIPVMAHCGLRPQSIHQLGGYRVQRDERQLLADAQAAEISGAFAIVLECIPADDGRADHRLGEDSHHRHRRRRRLRRPGARVARSAGPEPRPRAASRQGLRRSEEDDDRRRHPATATKSARGSFRARNTRFNNTEPHSAP